LRKKDISESIQEATEGNERQVTLTRQGEEALLVVVPLWEKAQAHIENGIGKDRLGSFLKDLSQIVSLARTS
jgi:hypothetical protein